MSLPLRAKSISFGGQKANKKGRFALLKVFQNIPTMDQFIAASNNPSEVANKITIKIEGRDPPTMTSEERTKLARECKEADFKIPHKDKKTKVKSRVVPKCPCVHVVPGKSGGGHHGLPILALSGENPPLALLSSNHLLTWS